MKTMPIKKGPQMNEVNKLIDKLINGSIELNPIEKNSSEHVYNTLVSQ